MRIVLCYVTLKICLWADVLGIADLYSTFLKQYVLLFLGSDNWNIHINGSSK